MDGMIGMREITGGRGAGARGRVLAPQGTHLMLMG